MTLGQLRRWLPICTCRLFLRAASHQQLALARVVAARLLDVDVLAGGAGQDRGRRVPVVAGGDDEDVDGLVVEDAAKIGDHPRRAVADLLHRRGRPLRPSLIEIANISDLDPRLALKGCRQAQAPAPRPHHSDEQFLIGPLVFLR